MANQYDVLGKAPGLEELNKLSPENVHLTIRGLNSGYGKMLAEDHLIKLKMISE